MQMDPRDEMGVTGSGTYYIQRGLSGSGPQAFQGSSQQQGICHLHNPNSPFRSGSNGFGSPHLHGDPSPAATTAGAVLHHIGVNVIAPPPPSETPMKRKRGRPRKYGQDGSVSLPLSSSSVSTITPNNSNKRGRGRGRPPGSGKKQRLASIGELMTPSSSGMSFTPHGLAVSIGEDIASKVISFCQHSSRTICVLSASGAVSTAILLQPSSSPGAISYELQQNGSFHKRTGNLTVSLASHDGRVIGGAIGGPLIAASPVQIIVGSFIWTAPKIKNKKLEEQEASDIVEDINNHQVRDNKNNTVSHIPQQQKQPSQKLIWSRTSRQIDMRHAHADIDLMHG